MFVRGIYTAAAVLLLWQGEAAAVQQLKSLYTAIDPRTCETIREEGASARLCKGLPGYPIYISEGGLRTYFSVGPDAGNRQAAQQTLNSDNSLFDPTGGRGTVEWRFVIRDEQPVPYATIVRYFTHAADRSGEVLVVTRVTEDEACQVAYVDALATPDAIVLARKLADTVARSGVCPVEPVVHGLVGRSPM